MIEMTDSEFEYIQDFVHKNYGINLSKKKKLIEARLYSTLTQKGMTSFAQYIRLLTVKDSPEVLHMVEKLTTNHTFFMRENDHFDYLKNNVLPELTAKNPSKSLSIWSAGCSSGQEVYNINMVMRDFFGIGITNWQLNSLATDISQNVMNKAKQAIYTRDDINSVPEKWQHQYFLYNKATDTFSVKPEITRSVDFRYLNLMDPFNFKTKFDIIFCRNVMIYFDTKTKDELANKFCDALKPGGYLFIGHSETLQYQNTKELKYVKPSIYRR